MRRVRSDGQRRQRERDRERQREIIMNEIKSTNGKANSTLASQVRQSEEEMDIRERRGWVTAL